MTYEMLEKELNEKKLHSIYLLYGEEKFLLETILKKIKKNFGELLQGINYIIIDENSINDIIYNIESPAFGYDKKLIIIKNSGLFKKDGRKKQGTEIQQKISSYINENIEYIYQNIVLVFLENEADKNEVYEAVNNNGIICNFEELTQIQLIKKLKTIATSYKVNIPENVIAYLIECSRH